MQKKTMLLILVAVLIVGAIVFLQRLNPQVGETNRTEIALTTANASPVLSMRLQEKALRYPKAVELVAPNAYINSEPFNLSQHIGKKIILVDFWTYSCINCQRTLPFVTAWDKKYRDQGLLIVGVHTPEFEFEKDLGNVQRAVEKYGVEYPVVLDNEYLTWKAYENHYWPRHYLIDIDGYIVEDHIGEGDYDETERKIQELLVERNEVLGLNEKVERTMTDMQEVMVRTSTEEIYFGYQYARGQIGNSEGWQPEKTVMYALPDADEEGKFYLGGTWKNNPDNMESIGPGTVKLQYRAQAINLVAGADVPTIVRVFIDGKNVRNITISHDDLYPLYASDFGTHELELKTTGGRMYTFTFG